MYTLYDYKGIINETGDFIEKSSVFLRFQPEIAHFNHQISIIYHILKGIRFEIWIPFYKKGG